jgi:hypothetical protein
VFPAKKGPVNTQTSRSCTHALRLVSTLYTAAAVIMIPGYTVPPTTRPSGYQLSLSNQFQNSWKPCSSSSSSGGSGSEGTSYCYSLCSVVHS